MKSVEVAINGFDEVWSLLKQFDQKCGLFLFKENSLLSRKEMLNCKKWPINMLMFLFLLVSTLIVKNFSLFFMIVVASISGLLITIYCTLATIIKNKKTIIHILQWFKSVSDPGMTYFHPIIRKMARDKLERQHKFTRKFIVFVGSFFQATLVIIIFGDLLLEILHSKFSPPFPFFLPFKDQNNWVTYGLTMLVQTPTINDLVIFVNFAASIFICLALYLLLMLDIVKESVEMLGKELQMKDQVHDELNEPSTSKGISLTTLMEINAKTKSETISIVQWLQIITDMLSDINQKINLLREMFSNVFLLIEISSFCSLMLFGLIFTIWKQQKLFGLTVIVYSTIHFAICSINEKVLERYRDIMKEFYNTPWYQLAPKDRKLILMAMNCEKIQHGFTAMGIHKVTIDRFGKIVKVAYTNCLILRDLIRKN